MPARVLKKRSKIAVTVWYVIVFAGVLTIKLTVRSGPWDLHWWLVSFIIVVVPLILWWVWHKPRERK